METQKCDICLSAKTPLKCDICNCASCKHCSQFIDHSSFELEDFLPEEWQDKTYCPNCYDENIEEEFEKIKQAYELAKDINVFDNTQGSETRLIRRIEKPISVKGCQDRQQALLHLAFQAALKGYDTIVDVELIPKRVKTGGTHKTTLWNGVATPVDPNRRK